MRGDLRNKPKKDDDKVVKKVSEDIVRALQEENFVEIVRITNQYFSQYPPRTDDAGKNAARKLFDTVNKYVKRIEESQEKGTALNKEINKTVARILATLEHVKNRREKDRPIKIAARVAEKYLLNAPPDELKKRLENFGTFMEILVAHVG